MAEMYKCPVCDRVAAWSDGRSVKAGDEADEFWCQTCGAEVPLARMNEMEDLIGKLDSDWMDKTEDTYVVQFTAPRKPDRWEDWEVSSRNDNADDARVVIALEEAKCVQLRAQYPEGVASTWVPDNWRVVRRVIFEKEIPDA